MLRSIARWNRFLMARPDNVVQIMSDSQRFIEHVEEVVPTYSMAVAANCRRIVVRIERSS